jgi:hypothetical protein
MGPSYRPYPRPAELGPFTPSHNVEYTDRKAMTTTVPFINSLSSGVSPNTERANPIHNTEREYTHAHVPGEHGHTHEQLNHPGRSLAVWRFTS